MTRSPFKSLLMAGLVAGSGLLGGCAPWPPYGVGGLAENHAPLWTGDTIATDTARLISVKERIDMLGRLGGHDFYPAAMEEIRLSYLRAARAHGGNMHHDTDAFLTELEAELEYQVRRLNDHRAKNAPKSPAECSL